MTGEEFDRILAEFAKESEKGKWQTKDGASLTFHFAKDGAPLNVAKVTEVERKNEWLSLRTSKGDRVAVGVSPLFAVSLDSSGTSSSARRAGF